MRIRPIVPLELTKKVFFNQGDTINIYWANRPTTRNKCMPRLSLIIIARDEEASIGRCLSSVSFADEIIVVENESTDKTVDIARQFGARVISAPDWKGFGVQKNRALEAATGDWVLSLDADEWVGEELAAEIKAVIAAPNGIDGYEIPRRNRFCGRIILHCGWHPDYVTRLFRRDKGRFSAHEVHEHVVISGRLGRLSTPMEHTPIDDLDMAHEKIGVYSAAAAKQLIANGEHSSISKALIRSIWAFVNAYFFRLGFLDGSHGAMIAAYNATYTFQKWARVAVAEIVSRSDGCQHGGADGKLLPGVTDPAAISKPEGPSSR